MKRRRLRVTWMAHGRGRMFGECSSIGRAPDVGRLTFSTGPSVIGAGTGGYDPNRTRSFVSGRHFGTANILILMLLHDRLEKEPSLNGGDLRRVRPNRRQPPDDYPLVGGGNLTNKVRGRSRHMPNLGSFCDRRKRMRSNVPNVDLARVSTVTN